MLDTLAQAVSGATPAGYAVGMGLGSLAFGLAARGAYTSFATKRLIEDTPTSRLRSVAQGYVQLQGVARSFDGEPIVAPLSQTPCCWYRYRVEEREQGKAAEWRRIEGEESTDLFLLDDGDGRCAVDPEGANVVPSIRQVWFGSERMPWSGVPGRSRWGWLGVGRYRYTEERLDVGTPLVALGFLVTQGGAAPSVSDLDLATLLREWKADQAALLARYDTNHDGRIDPAEWEQARADAREELARRNADNLPPAIDVLSRPAQRDRPFLLAAGTESDLVRREYWIGAGLLVLTAALAASLMFALLHRL